MLFLRSIIVLQLFVEVHSINFEHLLDAVSSSSTHSGSSCTVQVIWSRRQSQPPVQVQATSLFKSLSNNVPSLFAAYLSITNPTYDCGSAWWNETLSLITHGIGYTYRSGCIHIVFWNLSYAHFRQTYGCQRINWQAADEHLQFHFIMSSLSVYEAEFGTNPDFETKIRKFDATVVFVVGGSRPRFGIACSHCEDMVQWSQYSNRLNLEGHPLAVSYTCSNNEAPMPPTSRHGLIATSQWPLLDFCMPQREEVAILVRKYNFTIRQLGITADAIDMNFTGEIRAGDYHRAWDESAVGCNQFYHDAGPARLLYCVDYARASRAVQLSSLFSPFDLYIWLTILFIILLIVLVSILLRKSKINKIVELWFAFACQFLRQQTPGKILAGQHATVPLLLCLWSLISTVLLSSLYEGVVTSEMVAPVPDFVIPSFKELLSAQYKVVWEGYPNQTHWTIKHFDWKFKANGISQEVASQAMIGTPHFIEHEKWVHLLENAGEVARLYQDSVIDFVLNNLKLINNERKDLTTRCYAQPEVFEQKEGTWCFVGQLSSTFAWTMSRLSGTGIYNALRSIFWYNQVRRTKRSYFSRGLEDPIWTPLALTEELVVVFWACGALLLICGGIFTLELIVGLIRSKSTVMLRCIMAWWRWKAKICGNGPRQSSQ